MKKLSRTQLRNINGAACSGCPYPPGTTFGPAGSGADYPCERYSSLPDCCKVTYFYACTCPSNPCGS